jgi:tetratricopeptide (TPR) repeat protein
LFYIPFLLLTSDECRFLYETGEHQAALSLVEKGWTMCPDPENSLHYAHLCNTAGVLYFEWNDLGKSIEMHRRALRIRSALIKNDNVLVGYSHFNIAQVHSARGHMDEALKELEATKKIFQSIGLLNDKKDRGLFMMVYGRAFFLKGDLQRAREIWEDAQQTLLEAFPDGSMLTAE